MNLPSFCAAAVARARKRGRPVLASWSTELDVTDDPIVLWSRFRTRTDRCFFWASPWSGRKFVAAGTMFDLTGQGTDRFVQVRRTWAEMTEELIKTGSQAPMLVGGFAFRPASIGERHTPFPDALLWLPTLQVVSGSTGVPARMTLNAIVRPDSDPAAIATELSSFSTRLLSPARQQSPLQPNGTRQVNVREFPSAESWQHLVASAVSAIRHGAFEKVVLARRVELQADSGFDLTSTLGHLTATSPNTTVFATQLHGHCFLGATPEYLVQVAAGTVRTLGLAGSTHRGATPAEDAELEQALLSSAKDNHEHEVVIRRLTEILNRHCADVWVAPAPTILKLSHVQHLCTSLGGRLVDNDLIQLVGALHPTPALGGHPSDKALRWLDANEPLDRGWYAAPVGWVDADGDGEFAVAIRSALVTGGVASLYAGCGVVAGSDPAAEYRETQIKLRGMLAALGAETTSSATVPAKLGSRA